MNTYFTDKTLHSVTFILCPSFSAADPKTKSHPVVLTQLLPTGGGSSGGGGGQEQLAAFQSTAHHTPASIVELLRETGSSGDIVFLIADGFLLTSSSSSPSRMIVLQDDPLLKKICNSNSSSMMMSLEDAGNKFDDACFFVGVSEKTVSAASEMSDDDDNNNNSSALLTKPENFVTGASIAEAMRLEGGGRGTLYLSCDYALFAATQQFTCGSTPERLRNCLSLAMMKVSSACRTFAETKLHKDHEVAWQLESTSSSSSSSWFASHFAPSLLQEGELDKSQFPTRIVPLVATEATRGGGGLVARQQQLVSTLIERFSTNINGFASFHAKAASVCTCRAAVPSSPWHDLKNNKVAMFSQDVVLVHLDADNELHQQMILEVFSSQGTIAALGTDCGVHDRESAAEYIRKRPMPMLRERGIGSFAIIPCGDSSSNGGNDNGENNNNSSKQHHPPVVGIAGLIHRQELAPFLDVGFALAPQFHGHGYASSAARLVLLWAQQCLLQRTIKAVTRESNAPSQRLLTRLGMKKEREFEGWGTTQQVWTISLY